MIPVSKFHNASELHVILFHYSCHECFTASTVKLCFSFGQLPSLSFSMTLYKDCIPVLYTENIDKNC